jgi:hypothetical protein
MEPSSSQKDFTKKADNIMSMIAGELFPIHGWCLAPKLVVRLEVVTFYRGKK